MLGSTLMNYFLESKIHNVCGTVRNTESIKSCSNEFKSKIISNVDINDDDQFLSLFNKFKPDIVINCIGVIKQLASSNDPLIILPTNSIFPHKLARFCTPKNIRVIHMSTDCVFLGDKGMYKEDDIPDATDLYGISKRLGEIDYPNTITLRTSIIGHEINGEKSLIDWFLSQSEEVNGFENAIFSGLPTVEMAHIIEKFVIPNSNLQGLFHVSASPISKYDLLCMVANRYNKEIKIKKESKFKIDRSLDSKLFKTASEYTPPKWDKLIDKMFKFREICS